MGRDKTYERPIEESSAVTHTVWFLGEFFWFLVGVVASHIRG